MIDIFNDTALYIGYAFLAVGGVALVSLVSLVSYWILDFAFSRWVNFHRVGLLFREFLQKKAGLRE